MSCKDQVLEARKRDEGGDSLGNEIEQLVLMEERPIEAIINPKSIVRSSVRSCLPPRRRRSVNHEIESLPFRHATLFTAVLNVPLCLSLGSRVHLFLLAAAEQRRYVCLSILLRPHLSQPTISTSLSLPLPPSYLISSFRFASRSLPERMAMAACKQPARSLTNSGRQIEQVNLLILYSCCPLAWPINC